MSSYDGWTLNKKLDELKELIEKNYITLGYKLMKLDDEVNIINAKLDALNGKKKTKGKRSPATGNA